MDAALCAALVLITLIPYAQTCSFGFVNIDDPGYVYENELLKDGLSLTSLLEATFGFHQANWHPLVWISYMLEVEITVKVAEKSGISPQSSRLLLDSRQKECSSPFRLY